MWTVSYFSSTFPLVIQCGGKVLIVGIFNMVLAPVSVSVWWMAPEHICVITALNRSQQKQHISLFWNLPVFSVQSPPTGAFEGGQAKTAAQVKFVFISACCDSTQWNPKLYSFGRDLKWTAFSLPARFVSPENRSDSLCVTVWQRSQPL